MRYFIVAPKIFCFSIFSLLAFVVWIFENFLESVSKSWGFQLSPRGLNSDFQWIWQMICLICWWNYRKCTHFVVIHNNTFSNFKFRIVQDRFFGRYEKQFALSERKPPLAFHGNLVDFHLFVKDYTQKMIVYEFIFQ